jgi:terminase small subunit
MTEELNYDERKQWARSLYTWQDKTIKDIALTVSVDEATVRNWVAEGTWDGIRRSSLISKSRQLQHFYNQLENINAKLADSPGEINTKDVDLIVKYTAAIKNLEADITVCQVIEVAELFVTWLRRKDMALTKAVTVKFDAFIKQRLAA